MIILLLLNFLNFNAEQDGFYLDLTIHPAVPAGSVLTFIATLPTHLPQKQPPEHGPTAKALPGLTQTRQFCHTNSLC